MKILNIALRNFRAAESVRINIANGAPGKVITLVGLNESGKTTILEGISNFLSRDAETKKLVETLHDEEDVKTFIPKHKRGMFSSSVLISAKITMDLEDFNKINSSLQDQNIFLKKPEFPVFLTVERKITFEDSSSPKETRLWTSWDYKYRVNKNSGNYRSRPKGTATDKTWHAIVKECNKLLPKIVYFPTFLFGMPDRIYLSEHKDETPQNLYYRKTISNILSSVNKKYSVQKHIVDRIKRILEDGSPLSLSDSDKTADIDAVVRDLANEISRVITGAWKDIIGGKTSNQRVEARWSVDHENEGLIYLELSLIAGERSYLLKERSMGFRWFFSFLFFTQFRRENTENAGTIFLFDEPASNLHSSAQTALLDSFGKIMEENDYIVYSTHSHYMINPLWLEKAYIVTNKASTISDFDLDSQISSVNDISAIPYRRFVADNPSRLTYFQPVLDALRYKLSPLNLQGPAIILEGKFDYYPFVYLLKRVDPDSELKCYSANGAGEMGVLISLFRAMNIPFLILLDADRQGKKEKSRYKKDYLLNSNNVMTIDEALPSLDGEPFEKLFGDDVKLAISNFNLSPENSLKSNGCALFQVLFSTEDYQIDLNETCEKFSELLNHINLQMVFQ